MELRSAITANFAVIINGERITNQTYIANYYRIWEDYCWSWTRLDNHIWELTGKNRMCGTIIFTTLCKDQGCLNALCLDGGGSVYLKLKIKR